MDGNKPRNRTEYNWHKDPDVKGLSPKSKLPPGVRRYCLPPEGHVRRCQGKSRRTQGQCTQWALKGRDFCRFHGGRLGKGGTSLRNMSIYARNRSAKLKELLTLIEEGRQDAQSLQDEIDMTRAIADRHVEILDKVLFAEKEVSPDLKMTVMKRAQESLSHVAELVTAQAKLTAMSSGTLSAEQLNVIVIRITRVITDRLQTTHPELMNEILSELQTLAIPEKDRVNIVIS